MPENNEVTVNMPLHLTHQQIHAVRQNELTRCDDADEMNKRIGWLICAYDVIVDSRVNQNAQTR